MADKMINSNIYKTVYILDFYINGTLKDTFAFSVRPQNENFTFAQRIGETKTFGGIVYEDYGNDSIKINLSGSTINRDVKKIYSRDGNKYYEDQDEINELYRIIQKYGQIQNLDNKRIELTDLESGKCWEVVINNLEYKRSKESPMNYTYTLQMTGLSHSIKDKVNKLKYEQISPYFDHGNGIIREYDDPSTWDILADVERGYGDDGEFSISDKVDMENLDHGKGFITKETEISKLSDKQKQLLSYAQETNDRIKNMFSGNEKVTKIAKTVTDGFNSFMEQIEIANTIVNEYTDIVTNFLDEFNPLRLTELLDSTKDAAEGIHRIIFDNAFKVYDAVLSYSTDLLKTVVYVKDYFSDGSIFNPNNIDPSILEKFGNSAQQFLDETEYLIDKLRSKAEECVVVAKGSCEDSYTVLLGNSEEDDIVIPVYGYTETTVKESDTWESLAKDNMDNEEYDGALAVYNKDKQLVTGETIYIPILEKGKSTNTENLVYNSPDKKDNYGTDILIENDGFEIQNNDIKLVSGTENLKQSIDNRLSTEMDSRIKISVYGIKRAVGTSSEVLVFVKNSIEETVLADPRVKSIDNLKVYGKGDCVYVSFMYTDINNKELEYGGTF